MLIQDRIPTTTRDGTLIAKNVPSKNRMCESPRVRLNQTEKQSYFDISWFTEYHFDLFRVLMPFGVASSVS